MPKSTTPSHNDPFANARPCWMHDECSQSKAMPQLARTFDLLQARMQDATPRPVAPMQKPRTPPGE